MHVECARYPVGKQCTRALMKEPDICVRRRRNYKVTTDSDLYSIACYHATLIRKS